MKARLQRIIACGIKDELPIIIEPCLSFHNLESSNLKFPNYCFDFRTDAALIVSMLKSLAFINVLVCMKGVFQFFFHVINHILFVSRIRLNFFPKKQELTDQLLYF